MSMNPRLLRPTASGFSPRSISGLALWLDAADGATLFQNSDGTVPATASSDPVGYWGDKSGNGRHAVQATAGNRGAISETTVGGRKVLAFDAATKNIVSPATVAQYVADATTSPKVFFAFVARPEGSPASISYGSPTNPNPSSRIFYSSDFGSAGGHIVDFGGIPGARLTGVVGDEANNVGHVYSAFRDGAIMSVRRDGVEILRKTNCTGVYSDTTGTLGINAAQGGAGTASWCEFLTYAASVSSANITRLERYLAARWGITLAPQVANADAQDWINRVYGQGGTVSTATARAVDTFCGDIQAAGIRDRFFRLNLFCGNSDASLAAVRTPLFRAPSLGGTQLGSATDSQTNFVAGDYAETGASGGLAGNRTALKHLETGFNGSDFSPYDFHVSSYEIAISDTSYDYSLGAWTTPQNEGFGLGPGEPGTYDFSTIFNGISASAAVGHQLAVQTGSANGRLYRNGSQVGDTYLNGSSTSSSWSNVTWDVTVFTSQANTVETYENYSSARLGGYSFGLALTAAQAVAFFTAMQAFQTALGRNV